MRHCVHIALPSCPPKASLTDVSHTYMYQMLCLYQHVLPPSVDCESLQQMGLVVLKPTSHQGTSHQRWGAKMCWEVSKNMQLSSTLHT